jgi:hypothetical protein
MLLRPTNSFTLGCLLVTLWSCTGPSREPLTATSEPLPIVRDCPHTMPEPDYHVYECAGYAVGVSDESPGPPLDVDEDLRALSSGFIERVQSDRRRHGARVAVEPMNAPIADRQVRGVSVLAVDPKDPSEVYSANYAVIVGRRSVVCSTSLNLGVEKCAEVLRAFVETAP